MSNRSTLLFTAIVLPAACASDDSSDSETNADTGAMTNGDTGTGSATGMTMSTTTPAEGSSDGGQEGSSGPGLTGIFYDDIYPIFEICTCHKSLTGQAGLSLQKGLAYDALLSDSSEADGLKRVLPGDSTMSYIINKLEGTQDTVGGSGEQMPRGLSPLSSGDIQTIKDWIDAGAPEIE